MAARHTAPSGVAPDAGVYAIRVFDPQGSPADLVDILLALDHVRQLAVAGMDIASVNLSVATDETFASRCDSNPATTSKAMAFRMLFDQLGDRGIPTAVASGNGGSHSGLRKLRRPACRTPCRWGEPTSMTTWPTSATAGRVSISSRQALGGQRGVALVIPSGRPGGLLAELDRHLLLVAPGRRAGAFALLEQAYPKASADQPLALLVSNGVP